MENKTEDCVSRFPVKQKHEFTYFGKKYELEQRLLTVGEKHAYEIKRDEVLLDPDIFDANFTKEAAENILDKKNKAKLEKLKQQNDFNEEEFVPEEEFFNKEDTLKIKTNGLREQKLNWDNNIELVAFSLMKNKTFGGYFKVDGEEITGIEEIIEYLNDMLQEQLDDLYIKAIRLTYPTEEMMNEVKQ